MVSSYPSYIDGTSTLSRACPYILFVLPFVIIWPDDTPVLLDVVAIAKSGMISIGQKVISIMMNNV